MDTQAASTLPDSGLHMVERCRAGEASAWRSVYETHFGFVYRVARRLGTPEAETEDVCQEVFLIAFRKLDSFERGQLSTWLYRITANIVSARHRKRRIRGAIDQVLGALGLIPAQQPRSPEQDLASRQEEDRVRQILSRMAPKKREVFALYEIEGLSGEQIAERVGCKVETVWTRLHYARLDFRRMAHATMGGGSHHD